MTLGILDYLYVKIRIIEVKKEEETWQMKN
jgi:hypothetical protein